MSKWPLNKAYFWEHAPFFRLLLPLIAGILLYEILPSAFAIGLLAITALSVYIPTVFYKKRSTYIDLTNNIALQVILISAGWAITYTNDIQQDKHWFGRTLNRADVFAAKLTAAPAEKEKTWKLSVEVLAANINGQSNTSTGKAFVYVYKTKDSLPCKEGDVILIPNKWQTIRNAGNPYEFDYAQYCAWNNIYYQQFIGRNELILYQKAAARSIPWIRRLHNWCLHQLDTYITDQSTAGLIEAMLIGEEANLDQELRQAYSETGIIHIIAISGSHITMFFIFISFLLSWIRHKKYNWLRFLLALPLVWTYVLMAGAAPSAVRAALMFSILSVGFALQKTPNTLNQLFATAFVLLCVQPMWLHAIGFQLSFVAVLSLILFYKPLHKLFTPGNAILQRLWQAAAVSISAEILVAPLVIYYFHMFPPLFVIANIAAYLFMGVVLLFGMAIILFCWLPPVASTLSAFTIFIVTIFHKLVYVMQEMTPQAFRFLQLKHFELLLVYTAIAALALFLLKQWKRSLYTGLTALCILFTSFCFNEWQALHQQILVVYNISKTNQVELVNSKRYVVINSDTVVNLEKKNYTLKPAHSGFHARKRDDYYLPHDAFMVGNKRVLLLHGPVTGNQTFPVDYLIINDTKASPLAAARLQQLFQPAKIIIGSNFSRKQVQDWVNACKTLNIPVHATSRDGAFILKNI